MRINRSMTPIMRLSYSSRCCFLASLLFLLAQVGVTSAQWSPVVPGIDHRVYRFESPQNDIFVTRMDRTSDQVIVDASLALGRVEQPGLSYNAETIPSQVARYDGAFGYWGRETARFRYKVVAAINGCGFSTANGFPDSAMAMNGALIKRTFGPTSTEVAGAMGFLYKIGGATPTPGTAFLGGELSLPGDRTKNRISFADGTWLQFHALNDKPRSNALCLYTHHHGARTPSTVGTTEIVVQTDNNVPFRILPWSNYVRGTVREIRSNSSGQTPIPFDCIVIVASGTRIPDINNKIPAVGTEVRFSQETSDSSGVDWTNMYAAIGPHWGVILRNSVKPNTSSPSYHVDVHPRTAVAFNSSYIYFVVVDGRSGRSSGMTLNELADFCQTELLATNAVNNDGGGSSTMWVDGSVRNVPSDGTPRAVANGLMMIQLQEKEVSTALTPGWVIRSKTSTTLRTGPGLNFHDITPVPQNSRLTVLNHSLNGLRAQNINGVPGYWWKVRTSNNLEGWLPQNFLNTFPVTPEHWAIH
jgi:hypothetical protein